MEDDLWIFGYGSLVWKADFPFEVNRTGHIKGFIRRFYQNSIDHRGTAEKPGRVVTLLSSPNPDSRVWGMAYKISDTDRQNVLAHLDHREKNGYERHNVVFYPSEIYGEKPKSIILYVATQNNPSFAGHITDLNEIANQIMGASGISGDNREYVHNLAKAFRSHFPNEFDEHLFALDKLLIEKEKDELSKKNSKTAS